MKWLIFILRLAVWGFLAILMMAFAIANRTSVLVSLDPFNSEMPSLGFAMPLWVALFGALICGIVLGGFAAWGAQARSSLVRSAQKRAKAKEGDRKDDTAESIPIIAPEQPSPLIATRPNGAKGTSTQMSATQMSAPTL